MLQKLEAYDLIYYEEAQTELCLNWFVIGRDIKNWKTAMVKITLSFSFFEEPFRSLSWHTPRFLLSIMEDVAKTGGC